MLTSEYNERDMGRELDRLSAGSIQFLANCEKIGDGIYTKNVTDIYSAPEKKQYIGRAVRPDSPC
jgi:hypothetical protein